MPHETEDAAAADALADELRAVLDALTSRSTPPGELAELTRIARGMRERLEAGALRTRWYDSGGGAQELSAASRRAYLEQSPVRGRQNPVAPPLVFEALTRPDGSPGVTASARLGPRYEGPPHGVHGGWVAALFDEVLGTAQSLGGPPGVAAVLEVRYRHALNYGSNKVRYTGMVPSGSRVCLYQTIKAVDPEKNDGFRMTSECKIMVEGHDRPALIAEVMGIFYP